MELRIYNNHVIICKLRNVGANIFLDTSKTIASFQGAVFSSEIGKKNLPYL